MTLYFHPLYPTPFTQCIFAQFPWIPNILPIVFYLLWTILHCNFDIVLQYLGLNIISTLLIKEKMTPFNICVSTQKALPVSVQKCPIYCSESLHCAALLAGLRVKPVEIVVTREMFRLSATKHYSLCNSRSLQNNDTQYIITSFRIFHLKQPAINRKAVKLIFNSLYGFFSCN